MSPRPSPLPLLAAVAALAAAPLAAAAAPTLPSYAVGSLPVAPGLASLEFPVRGPFRGEVGAILLGQGTYDDHNPFEYLSAAAPFAWLHFDGVPNLRLSAAFMEIFYRAVAPLGTRDTHEERVVGLARVQQPRGTAALYEVVQLDVRSFDDAAGTHRIVFRPRFRVGQGLNLDALRVHSLVLYQEVAFRFASGSYAARPFEFFRAFVGYLWTTRRGTFVTLGVIGQISLNPAATRYDFLYGPVLTATYKLRPATKAAEQPPAPPNVEVP